MRALVLLLCNIARAMVNSQQPARCPRPFHEHLFRGIIHGLFIEQLVPPGSIVDAGSNTGEEACFYAERNPDRIVHAIDPLSQNVVMLQARSRHLSNMRSAVGGLGSTCKWLTVGRTMHRKRAGLHAQISGTAKHASLKHACTNDTSTRRKLEASGSPAGATQGRVGCNYSSTRLREV